MTATASTLETVYQVGSDGSRVPVAAWDEANATTCQVWNTADGLRCGPTDPADLRPTTLILSNSLDGTGAAPTSSPCALTQQHRMS